MELNSGVGRSVTEESGVYSAGPVMSTKMMPPPGLEPLERSVTKLLSGITDIARDGDKLSITAGDRSEKFSGSTPATKDQVRWMKN